MPRNRESECTRLLTDIRVGAQLPSTRSVPLVLSPFADRADRLGSNVGRALASNVALSLNFPSSPPKCGDSARLCHLFILRIPALRKAFKQCIAFPGSPEFAVEQRDWLCAAGLGKQANGSSQAYAFVVVFRWRKCWDLACPRA